MVKGGQLAVEHSSMQTKGSFSLKLTALVHVCSLAGRVFVPYGSKVYL